MKHIFRFFTLSALLLLLYGCSNIDIPITSNFDFNLEFEQKEVKVRRGLDFKIEIPERYGDVSKYKAFFTNTGSGTINGYKENEFFPLDSESFVFMPTSEGQHNIEVVIEDAFGTVVAKNVTLTAFSFAYDLKIDERLSYVAGEDAIININFLDNQSSDVKSSLFYVTDEVLTYNNNRLEQGLSLSDDTDYPVKLEYDAPGTKKVEWQYVNTLGNTEKYITDVTIAHNPYTVSIPNQNQEVGLNSRFKFSIDLRTDKPIQSYRVKDISVQSGEGNIEKNDISYLGNNLEIPIVIGTNEFYYIPDEKPNTTHKIRMIIADDYGQEKTVELSVNVTQNKPKIVDVVADIEEVERSACVEWIRGGPNVNCSRGNCLCGKYAYWNESSKLVNITVDFQLNDAEKISRILIRKVGSIARRPYSRVVNTFVRPIQINDIDLTFCEGGTVENSCETPKLEVILLSEINGSTVRSDAFPIN